MSFNYSGKSAKNNVALQLLQKVAEVHKVCAHYFFSFRNSKMQDANFSIPECEQNQRTG